MKYIILFSIFLVLIFGFAQAWPTYQNPIIDDIAADPCIIKLNGFYYMVYTQHDKIDIVKSPILTDFRNRERIRAYTAPPNRANLWAPEIHQIQGNLYIYFTMDDGIADENHRMYVIKADDPNNPMGTWGLEVRLLPEEEMYGIDGTVLQYGNGELYYIWTGFSIPPGKMNLFIAKMENPMKVIAPRTFLREPMMEWEMHGFPVNEGAFFIQNAGRTFLVFSASSTFTADYCLGIMGIDDLKDPLVRSNWWNDVNHCVFHRNDPEGVFTTGHASFVRSPDDSELWMVYHATDNVNDNGRTRTARIQKLDWNPDNAPRFPWAMGLHRELLVPSGQFKL